VHYDSSDLKNVLKVSKGIIFKNEKIVIIKEGAEVALSSKQLYGLLKKLQFYLELDERCIDRDGPQFHEETKAP
jgi:hypothetical protein